MDQITLSQAIDGYTIAANARRLSAHTLADYSTTFRKLAQYLKTDPLASITTYQVRRFLAAQRDISKMGPFTEADIRAMLSSLDKSKAYSRPGKRECNHSLGSSVRNRAILLVLVDTGLCASELCELRIKDVDLNNRRLIILGKGSKERIIPFSAVTSQAIWRYQATRPKDSTNDFLFVTPEGQPLDRVGLGKLILRIGERAGVTNAHSHRFRHTFAINLLRNGGNAYALQMMLGHLIMEMVRRYLALAQADVEAAHRRASPVANWRL
jgi:integrase/recombinase XerD